MRHVILVCCIALFTFGAVAADERDAAPSTSPQVHKIEIGGDGGWDYLTIDSDSSRLYVSRGNRVIVVDLATEKLIGELSETPGIHGIAVVPESNKGFTSNGGDGTVTVFDTKTLKASRKIEAHGVPDAILYDAFSKRVFTFNHKTDDVTAIDAVGETVVGTVNFEAEPEAAVADGQGHIFVNLRSTSEIGEFDATTLKILHRWPLAPGVRPNGLAIDAKHRRLFSTCGNQKMVVMNADTGAVIQTVDIGKGSDGCEFDPGTGQAFSSNGDGTLTIVGEATPGKFDVVSTVKTQPSSRTLALDRKTHRLYLSSATIAENPAGGEAPRGRRNYVPGSFAILVVKP